jgi:hypothetical protein
MALSMLDFIAIELEWEHRRQQTLRTETRRFVAAVSVWG